MGEYRLGSLDHAIDIAHRVHRGHTDKGGKPYILHPMRVMVGVALKGGTDNHLIVSVLHDVVEDAEPGDLAPTELEHFPDEVLSALDAITRRDGEVYADYIDRVAKNSVAREVKLVDLRDNMDPRRSGGVRESLTARYVKAVNRLDGEDV